jgi:hypothetical protein
MPIVIDYIKIQGLRRSCSNYYFFGGDFFFGGGGEKHERKINSV